MLKDDNDQDKKLPAKSSKDSQDDIMLNRFYINELRDKVRAKVATLDSSFMKALKLLLEEDNDAKDMYGKK